MKNDIVYKALLHVRESDPETTYVFYSEDGRWFYCHQNFAASKFTANIDIGILEDAADSLVDLPAAFSIESCHES